MHPLRALIADNEDWLVEQVLAYAKAHGYTDFTSTLEQPWRESVCGLSQPILDALAAAPGNALAYEPTTTFAIEEARLHRQRGVSCELFVGMMTDYRRSYIDLVRQKIDALDDRNSYQAFVHAFFDKVETAIRTEWDRVDASALIAETDRRTRLLMNEKNKYLTIFESMHEPVVILDASGEIDNLNHAATSLFDAAAVPGAGYYTAGDYAGLADQIRTLGLHGADAGEFEHALVTPTGVRDFIVRTQRMLDVSEKYLGTVVILSDVTVLKRAQRDADAASRAKSVFLATMSHEIRSPISGILGLGSLLRDTELSAQQATYVQALMTSGEVLLETIRDVLDYSKFETDAVTIKPVDFAPRDLVDRLVSFASSDAERKGLAFRVDIAPDVPVQVHADRAKIQRILLNLVSNAIKFTADGGVTLRVETQAQGLRFTVTDTGHGIPEAVQANLFTPFFQHPLPGRLQPEGTGLGLAICRRLAEALGASIQVASPDGGGSRFQVDCPTAAPTGDAPAPAPAASAPTVPLDVLVVEDDAVNALVVEGFLARDGHQPETVDTGEAALAALAARRYDFILMDIRMPGIGGLETIRRIRELPDAGTSATPILLLTANPENVPAAPEGPGRADGILEKPFSPDALRRQIGDLLNQLPTSTVFSGGAPDAAGPTLDAAVIGDHVTAIGRIRTDRIVRIFLSDATDKADALRKARHRRDGTAVRDLAHQLKCSAETLGLRHLAACSAAVERALSTSGPHDLHGLATSLLTALETGAAALAERSPAGQGPAAPATRDPH